MYLSLIHIYESLHITVMGPEQKWVEVQIRTERMDEIAEKGDVYKRQYALRVTVRMIIYRDC